MGSMNEAIRFLKMNLQVICHQPFQMMKELIFMKRYKLTILTSQDLSLNEENGYR